MQPRRPLRTARPAAAEETPPKDSGYFYTSSKTEPGRFEMHRLLALPVDTDRYLIYYTKIMGPFKITVRTGSRDFRYSPDFAITEAMNLGVGANIRATLESASEADRFAKHRVFTARQTISLLKAFEEEFAADVKAGIFKRIDNPDKVHTVSYPVRFCNYVGGYFLRYQERRKQRRQRLAFPSPR